MITADTGLPLEHFIQAVQSQLDNAQTAMAIKARNLDLPLTFAIKDVNLDLRAHVELVQSEVRIRPAGPTDPQASVFHLVFTAITRPMIEENAIAFGEDPEDRSIEELKAELSEEDRRRLEWVGVRTVTKLREMEEEGGSQTMRRVTRLPSDRLRRALARATAPMLEQVSPVTTGPDENPDLPNLLRIRGRNLKKTALPRVTIAGEPVGIIKADERELLIAPKAHQMAGELAVMPSAEERAAIDFDLRPFWNEPQAPAPAPEAAPR